MKDNEVICSMLMSLSSLSSPSHCIAEYWIGWILRSIHFNDTSLNTNVHLI